MKNLFAKTIGFIRENPSLIYSLILVVIIPAAFFINTYSITNRFEDDIDKITQANAVLVENIINRTAVNQEINDPESLQLNIEKIAQENEGIMPLSIAILKPSDNNNEAYQIIASSKKELVGQESDNIQNILAWKKPEGIAFLSQDGENRYWNITKSFADSSGQKIALISTSFSLVNTDKMINSTINYSYLILIVTILVVILFVSNQARLFGYALTLSKLKEIDKMKDMFISIAGHELRSPLTAINGYVELLKEKKEITQNEESNHFIKNISISIDRLQNLINDILEVSRIEGNRLPVEITSFNPHEIIPQTIEEIRSHAVQKGLALNYVPGEKSALVKADTNRLKQVLINLISNSIKYTEKGSVEVTTSMKDGNFLITVADTGIGISAEDQTKLFQKFNRIQTEKTKNIIGTGLGLWITQELVKRMEGKITLESIEGVGSHFTVYLPLDKKGGKS
jgi:signal transduction histidine kinase